MGEARNPRQRKINRSFWSLLRYSGKSQLWTESPATPEFPTQTSVDRKNLKIQHEVDKALEDLWEIGQVASASTARELEDAFNYRPAPRWKSLLTIYRIAVMRFFHNFGFSEIW